MVQVYGRHATRSWTVPPSGSDLEVAAAAISAGEWATFTSTYPTTLAALLDVGGGKRCTEYADKMVWDASLKKIYFTGGGHGQEEKTIVYDDATNTWEDLGSPPWYTPVEGNAIHGYQHNTLIGTTHYYGQFASRIIHTRDVTQGNSSWSVLGSEPNQFSGLTGAVEYFPSYGAGGSLIVVQGTGADAGTLVRWFDSGWSEVATPAMGAYHNIGLYSPARDLMFFGGGANSAKLYTLSNAGSVVARAACPVNFGIIDSCNFIDPVSGDLVAITGDQTVRVFDQDANTWGTDTAPPAGFWSDTIYAEGEVMGNVACSIPEYDVTLFLTIAGPTAYLRKGRA